ncbi:hypothetical protein LINPERHAP1_LOCUS43628 [Linum perenne]
MKKGKGQGRSCLARRLLVRGQGTVLKVLGLPGGLSFGQLRAVCLSCVTTLRSEWRF